MRARRLLLLIGGLAVVGLPALAAEPDGDDDGDDGPAVPVTELVVNARRLDAARANVEPGLGAASYALSNAAIESRPGSENLSLAQVLLQVPGVQQDGSGQLHVRQSQGDLQYRINNVMIPEGLSDLGEVISARMAQKVELVTGALPAQYGFQAGGVVNVTTKSGVYLNGGQAELYGGGRGDIEPSFEYGAGSAAGNLFVSGSFQRNGAGSAPLDGAGRPLHARADQLDGFAYLDRQLGADTRVSLILALSDDRLQEPNARGLTAPAAPPPGAAFLGPLAVNGVSSFPSAALDDHHRDATRLGVLSLIRATDRYTLQASVFARQSVASRWAAGVGDLIYKGLGEASQSRDLTYGLQLEGVYEAASAHTLRGGLLVSGDRREGRATTLALPLDAQGRQTSDVPLALDERLSQHWVRASAFAEDEWRLTDTLTLNTGLRADTVSAPTANAGRQSALSPRWSAVWTPRDGTVLHLGYARYFLPAPAEDVGETPAALAGTSGAWPTAVAGDLRAEHDDYVDLGARQTWGGLGLGVDAYWRQAHDLIAEGRFGPAALSRAFNYAEARIRGVDVSLTYDHGPWSAWANLSVSRSEGRGVVSGQAWFTAAQLAQLAAWRPLAQDQPWSGSAGGSYRLGRVRLSADMLYGGGLPGTPAGGPVNAARLAPHAQLDLAVVWRAASFGQRPLDLRLDVINALDARYVLRDGSGLGDGPAQWGPRRGVFVGFEQGF